MIHTFSASDKLSIDSLPIGILVVDDSDNVICTNTMFLKWTCFEEQEVLYSPLGNYLSSSSNRYFEIHVKPLLNIQDEIEEIAVQIQTANSGELLAFMNASKKCDFETQGQFTVLTI